jgi:hypothetical protein
VKIIVPLLAMGVLYSPAYAQHGISIDDGTANLRMGAGCRLSLYGQALGGTCAVLKEHGSPDTYIKAGSGTYRIARASGHGAGKRVAEFYQVTPTGQADRLIGTVLANGSCWVGDGIRFCAE